MGVITLTGSLGSGKSTVGVLLAKTLGYKYISGGNIFREVSKELNISVLEVNNLVEKLNLDNKVDNYLKELNNENNIVVDSKLAWYFIKESFGVYLHVDLPIAVDRVSKSNRTTEGDLTDKLKLENNLKMRRNLEVSRFQKLYGINIDDRNNYDLVIDTTNLVPEQIVATIVIAGYSRI